MQRVLDSTVVDFPNRYLVRTVSGSDETGQTFPLEMVATAILGGVVVNYVHGDHTEETSL